MFRARELQKYLTVLICHDLFDTEHTSRQFLRAVHRCTAAAPPGETRRSALFAIPS